MLAMTWKKLGSLDGWTAYWETRSHRMYARTDGVFGKQKDFEERPADLEMAWTVFRAWVRSRR